MSYTPSVVFAENPLNRAGERRDTAALQALYQHENSRVLPFRDLNPAIRDSQLDWHPTAAFPIENGSDPGAIFLGTRDDQAFFAVALDKEIPELQHLDARSVASNLPAGEAGIMGQARMFLHWHARTRFCSICGGRNTAAEGGAVRLCTACKAQHFPKIEPAVIMLLVDREKDRCLLGRQASWAPGRFSTLAGFVEAGETLEAAVRRESLEEAGIRVGAVRYMFSQPWPFPASLMLGFIAEAESTTIVHNDQELAEARWVSRAEAALMAQRSQPLTQSIETPLFTDSVEPHLPGPISLGYQLVMAWLAE